MPTNFRGGFVFLAAITALIWLGATPCAAFDAAPQNSVHEIPLPAYDLFSALPAAADAAALAVENRIEDRYGRPWKVHTWNRQSGTPHWVFGSSIPVSSAILTPGEVEQLSRQILEENSDILRADPESMRLTGTPSGMDKWAAHYQQTYHGLDVWQATVRMVFSESGRLMIMGSDCYSDIDLETQPSLTPEEALRISQEALPFDPARDTVKGEPELLILPYPVSESAVEHHLVYRTRLRTESPLGIWVSHVDAHDGTILWRYNDIHFAYHGNAEGPVHNHGYCDGDPFNQDTHYLDVDVSGVGTVTTDIDGNWSINGTGGPRTVSCDLYGPYVDMNNYNGNEAFFSGTAQEDLPFTVLFDDANSRQDERDCFDAVNDIHALFQLFDPGFAYPNARISAYVNRNDGYCPGNAWWDGTINFCASGGGYANTGELQQVVHHEYGHGVQASILGSQGNEGLGEGNADILGNLLTQDSVIGRGFYVGNCTSGIRNSLNNLIYPDDVVGQQIHYAGQVIAGFNWDAMVLLQDQYGSELGTVMSAERWHFGRVLMHPYYQPDQVLATFVADDDNGDLDDGTPHHAIFCQAAQNHNFQCPEILVGVFVYHDNLPYTGDAGSGYEVVGEFVSLGHGTIDPSTVRLHYRVDGGTMQDAAMAPTGAPDMYSGMIPAQAWGSTVQYYLSAENEFAEYGTSPRNAPEALHYFQVGDEFADEMETDTAWSVGYPGDTASSGIWVRVDPIGTSYGGGTPQPEDDHTPDGTDCWITGQHLPGESAGYADVDGGHTTLLSPRFDLTDAADVAVSYWKWYSNDLGNNPGQDYWDVDVTNDGGQSWTTIEHTTQSVTEWTQVSLDLLDYVPVPGIVQFRFVADDTPPGSLVEAGVDDFLMAAVFDPTAVEGDGLTVRFLTGLGQNQPNPFNPRTEIRFALATEGPASLRVFDASGRLVRTLAEGALTAGEHSVVWDGTDESGRALSSGTYFYRLETPERSISARMVLLK